MTSVLVLDDRDTDRELLSTVLGYAGYTVLEASSGEEGLEVALANRPDLVIADILMPNMDGYDFVRRLRADPQIGSTRVMFCTATYAVEEVRRLAHACGVEEILEKPSAPEEILRMVAAALGSTREPGMAAGPENFRSEHFRVLSNKLIEKVRDLESASREQERLHEDLREAQRETAESLMLLETLQSTAPVGVGYVDKDLRIRRMNDTLATVSGVPAKEQVGKTVEEVVPEIWPQIEPIYRRVLEKGEAVVNQEVQGELPGAPGQTRLWLSSYYPVRVSDEVIGVGLIVVDITERKQEEDLRSVVMENMAEGLLVMDGEGKGSLMNAAATAMLGWSADELQGRSVHDIIHAHPSDDSPCARGECALARARGEGRTVRVAEDVFTRRDGQGLPVAYSAAPLLSGTAVRGAVIVFRDTTEEQAERARVQRELDALTWVGRTRDALEEGRMMLFAQPIIPLQGAGDPSQELLLRMVGRAGEIIPPGRFLPAAEKFGLIGEIDRWVVAQAIGLASGGLHVQANLSGESIGNTELLSLIERELHETGAEASNIVFEITETALMLDIDAGVAFANGVVRLGCGLALDDFGTGFGSFTYLKRLPIRYLKIDIEFVRKLASNPENQHLVKAIINLAQGFGQQTIAEGVEDEETLELLREYGVDFAQGFHLGRPAPVSPSPRTANAVMTT